MDSLLYVAEVWGCCKQTDALEQPGSFWEFGLQNETMMLPLPHIAGSKKCCILGKDDESGGIKDC